MVTWHVTDSGSHFVCHYRREETPPQDNLSTLEMEVTLWNIQCEKLLLLFCWKGQKKSTTGQKRDAKTQLQNSSSVSQVSHNINAEGGNHKGSFTDSQPAWIHFELFWTALWSVLAGLIQKMWSAFSNSSLEFDLPAWTAENYQSLVRCRTKKK